MKKYKAAVCQMDSGTDREKNLKSAEALIREAADEGASLVVLPEMFSFLDRDCRAGAESVPGPTADFLCAQAKKHGIWLAGGSFPCFSRSNPSNTLLFIDPDGNIRCRYSKLHMFDVEIEDGISHRESETTSPGKNIVLSDTPLGRIGFAICYDIRFGEMFKLMALNGAQLVCVAANFTLESGAAHWESLLRARAIENGMYIAAADQCGQKTFMNSYGNSMIINPWGKVIARLDKTPGIACAEIDPDCVEKTRRQIPSLSNMRNDVYRLESTNVNIVKDPPSL